MPKLHLMPEGFLIDPIRCFELETEQPAGLTVEAGIEKPPFTRRLRRFEQVQMTLVHYLEPVVTKRGKAHRQFATWILHRDESWALSNLLKPINQDLLRA